MTEDVVRPKRKRTRPLSGGRACGGCALLALLGLLTLAGVYQLNNHAPEFTVPMPIMPADNAYDDFVRAGKLAKSMKHLSPYSMPGPSAQTYTYANFKACAHDAIPVQTAVRQGLGKTYMNPPERSARAPGFQNLALFRETARTLAGKARYEDLSGHPAQAADTLLDSYEEGVMMPRGGPLIAGLVGIAIEAISIRSFEPLLPKLSAQELAHVAARLDTIQAKRVSYADIMTEEGNTSAALLLEMFRDPKNGGLGGGSLRDMFGTPGTPLSMQDRLMMLQLMFTNKATLLKHNRDYFIALAAEAKQPYKGPSRVSAGNDVLLSILAGVFGNSRVKFVSMEAVTNLLRTEVALERCKRTNGRYPDTLSHLVPTYLNTVPVDPCANITNAPLRYQVQADGKDYLLYSIGADQKDDGGQPQKNIGDGSNGDIVARHLWAKQILPIAKH